MYRILGLYLQERKSWLVGTKETPINQSRTHSFLLTGSSAYQAFHMKKLSMNMLVNS